MSVSLSFPICKPDDTCEVLEQSWHTAGTQRTALIPASVGTNPCLPGKPAHLQFSLGPKAPSGLRMAPSFNLQIFPPPARGLCKGPYPIMLEKGQKEQ